MSATLTKAGRYEITGEIGRGAMGVVYRATDPFIGRTVAVKTLQLSEQGTGLTKEELLNRFQTEARAAGLLTHPNIVVVYDAGEEDGLFFITMELVEGKSLQALLDAGQLFPLPRVFRIMEQACSALQFAHDRNIVHRDIKPANLMLTPDDTVKVTDFGTAKILQFGTVNQTTHVMGTPSYMSPEQVKGKVVDGRSDIFSLGVLLYEMVTGEKPFPGQNITTVIYKIVNEEPLAPRELDPSIHPGLNAVILKALAKEPSERYQHCRDLIEDLRNYRTLTRVENPGATLPLGIGSPHSHAAAQLLEAQVAATSRSLNARSAAPFQTPVVRRTGTLQKPEPRPKNLLTTVLAATFLLLVIVFGAQKIRPVFEAARQNPLRDTQIDVPQVPVALKTVEQDKTAEAASVTPGNVDASPAPQNSGPAPVKSAAGKPAPANQLSPAAADWKGRIERVAAERRLRLSVKGTGTTLWLSGKLRPAEHGELLKFLGNAPPGVQVVDDIQYDDTLPPNASAPVSPAGSVRIVTSVAGALASLSSGSSPARVCETPCSFSGLDPGDYSLQVKKSGFQPVQTALQLRSGESADQKIQLEPLALGLFVVSQPAGADVFINGDKQSGQTPLTIPLAPGKYNLVLRLSGYEAYAGQIEVRPDGQSKVNAELRQKSSRIAWAQISSFPEGAEIWLDGSDTGQHAPARVEIPSGIHNIVLKLDGYQAARQVVQASEGGTIPVSKILTKNR
ncbi:MAG TPA: PEGA domain-containing protein [Candidatus Acidoferrum sp.]|nr:PEGA domain-containing protein [Candidatus Acidoferrum sp.]